MPDLQHPSQAPKPGDLIEYTEERIIPTGTWHLDLRELLDELGVELAAELAKSGVIVGYNAFLSRFEEDRFSYTLTVALRVHQVWPPGAPEEQVQLAGVPWWLVFRAAVALAGLGLLGWIASSAARVVESSPEAVSEISEAAQVVFVSLALIAFVFLLYKVLR